MICSSRSIFHRVTVSAVHIFYYFFCFLLTAVVSDHGWRCIPVSVKPDLGELISTLLESKASSTEKRYKREILKFIDYCNFSGVRRCLLFPLRS